MPPCEARLHQCARQPVRRHAPQHVPVLRAQQAVDVRQREQAHGTALARRTQVQQQQVGQRTAAVERQVVDMQLRFLRRREPRAGAAQDGRLQLGIDLRVDLHAQETPAARRVAQQLAAVARADERGDARQTVVVAAVAPPQGQPRELHQVLQLRVAPLADAVELVEAHQPANGQLTLHAALRRQVGTVAIVGREVGRRSLTSSGATLLA